MRDVVHQTMVFLAGGLLFLVLAEWGFEIGVMRDERDLLMLEFGLTCVLATYLVLWLIATVEARRKAKLQKAEFERILKLMKEDDSRKKAEAQLRHPAARAN